RSGPQSIAAGSLWRTALAQRAKCEAPQAATVAGVKKVQRAVCQSMPGNVPYAVYTLEDGDSAVIAEGFVPLEDLIEAGLKIITGAAPIPESALQAQPGGEYAAPAGSAGASLAAAVSAAEQTSDWLKNRAHVENQVSLYEDAERDFRSLAASQTISDQD